MRPNAQGVIASWRRQHRRANWIQELEKEWSEQIHFRNRAVASDLLGCALWQCRNASRVHVKFTSQHLMRALRGMALAFACVPVPGAVSAPLPPPFPPHCAAALQSHPKWANNAVAYGVAPWLFGRHPLRAVTKKLDELQNLGVNVIWLSPVAAAPRDDYGYAVTDPLKQRPELGTATDLRALVTDAHARGIHVIFDFAANHLSSQSRYYLD